MDVCKHAVCTRPPLWTACRTSTSPPNRASPAPSPLWTPTQSPPTLRGSSKCNYTLGWRDTFSHQIYMCVCVSTGHESDCVCVWMCNIWTLLCVIYRVFLLHTAREEQFELSVPRKALWVMPPSCHIRKNIYISLPGGIMIGFSWLVMSCILNCAVLQTEEVFNLET